MTTNADLKSALEQLRSTLSRIEDTTRDLKGLMAEKKDLESNILPAMFSAAGIKQAETDDGAMARLSLVASGSLPKEPDEREAALQWLIDEGYEASIEAAVTASWARGDRAKALALFERLRQDNSVKVKLDEGVNHMTLGKLMKDRITNGQPVSDKVGIEVIPRVRFTTRGTNGEE